MPETVVDTLIDVVKVFLQDLEITTNSVDFVFKFLHGSVVLAYQFMELFELLFVQ
jgi:hypothetical protein